MEFQIDKCALVVTCFLFQLAELRKEKTKVGKDVFPCICRGISDVDRHARQ